MDGIIRLILAIFAALVLSCTAQSIMVWLKLVPAIAPYEFGVNEYEPRPTAETPKRGDIMIPELRMVSDQQKKPSGYATKVDDGLPESSERAEFPNTVQ